MEDIWKKCARSKELEQVEQEAEAFLRKFSLLELFPLSLLEQWIFNCPAGGEATLFDPILQRIDGGSLADLSRFDEIFRTKLFSMVPQKVLNGLSPVRYALNLKMMRDG